MRTLALIVLASLAPALPAAPAYEITTRGQAQLVARRHAIDEALGELRGQVQALRVSDQMTLGQWMGERTDRALVVEQALRDAEMLVDEPTSGRWQVLLQVSVADLNEALHADLRQGLIEGPHVRLRAAGSAAIPWEGSDVNTVSRPRQPEPSAAAPTVPITENLPPSPEGLAATPPAPPEPVARELVVALDQVEWASEAVLTATGQARTTREAEVQAPLALAQALRALPIGPSATVGDWANASPENARALETVLAEAVESDRRLTSDGISEVDLTVPLRGLRHAILGQEETP